jgi:hypothetical protein
MTRQRIDFYAKVHKGLRAGLFALSQQAAATDYCAAQDLSALARRLDELLSRLTAHANHEERFIHPLLVEKTGESPFDAEHRTLEVEQESLARLLGEVGAAPQSERRDRGRTFYRALNVFIARQLEHLDGEEGVMPVLWERCSDEELVAVMSAFAASRPLEEALHSLKGIRNVIDVRNIGLMGAVELEPKKEAPGSRGYAALVKCFEAGVLIRYTGDTLAFSPPLIVEKAQIDRIADTVRTVLQTLD